MRWPMMELNEKTYADMAVASDGGESREEEEESRRDASICFRRNDHRQGRNDCVHTGFPFVQFARYPDL